MPLRPPAFWQLLDLKQMVSHSIINNWLDFYLVKNIVKIYPIVVLEFDVKFNVAFFFYLQYIIYSLLKTKHFKLLLAHNMSHNMTKPTKWVCAKGRFRSAQSDQESSLCAQWVAKDPSFRHVDSEDSDQTGRMPRLIWVFAERTAVLLVCQVAAQL